MPKLFHYTSSHKQEHIKSEGLKIPSEMNKDSYINSSEEINFIVNKYKPSNVPNFMERDKCVFFHGNRNSTQEEQMTIVVDSEKLQQDRIFAFNYEIAHRIWGDVVDAPFSGDYSNIPLEVSAKEYWDSMITYEEFLKLDTQDRYEILYFSSVPVSLLSFENDTLNEDLISLFNILKSKYNVKEKDNSSFSVYDNEEVVFTINYMPTEKAISVYCENNQISNECLKTLELNIRYEEKEVNNFDDFERIFYEKVTFLS